MNDGCKRIAILPTGDEIAAGIVRDTDSPMAEEILTRLFPGCRIRREPPAPDRQEDIRDRIVRAAGESDLVVLIGGSGGGHRFSPSLACDYTHSAMEEVLTESAATSLYGKNGHLWSRLVCGRLGETVVFNLPGPFREAEAALKAFAQAWESGQRRLDEWNRAMAQAVAAQYGEHPGPLDQ